MTGNARQVAMDSYQTNVEFIHLGGNVEDILQPFRSDVWKCLTTYSAAFPGVMSPTTHWERARRGEIDLWACVVDGECQAAGATCLNIRDSGEPPMFEMLSLGGRREPRLDGQKIPFRQWGIPMLEFFTKLAYERGATTLRLTGRREWKRVLPAFREVAVVWEMDLETEDERRRRKERQQSTIVRAR